MIFHLTRQPLAGATSVPLIAATLFWAVIACAQESSMRPSGAQLLVAVEDLDTFSVRIEQMWRVRLKGTVESVGGLGVWDDGVVWGTSINTTPATFGKTEARVGDEVTRGREGAIL